MAFVEITTDIHFHGFIGGLEGGYAMAADRNGSRLLASAH
jgi:hypothetical protein